MPMISYAQNREDVLLRRFFSDREDGFYIDVGANDPVQHSVTKHFYDRGWRGINIEPDKVAYTRLCSQRQRDVNLNVGLSSSDTTLEFLECPSNPELSTFSPEMADIWRKQGVGFAKRTVPVVTLARVCEDHVDRPIDFLKIDAEAHEREVIEGGDWGRWRPRVILIEETQPDQWEPLLLAADYLFAAFDGLNRYYVRAEDRRLLSLFNAPVCHYDDYIPYDHQQRIDELNARIAVINAHLVHCKDLGPNSLRIAAGLHRMSARYPRLASAVKHITRLGA
jgi:FkbM family methyltransferase